MHQQQKLQNTVTLQDKLSIKAGQHKSVIKKLGCWLMHRKDRFDVFSNTKHHIDLISKHIHHIY